MAYNPASSDFSAGAADPGAEPRPTQTTEAPTPGSLDHRSASDEGEALLNRVVQGAHDTVDRMASTAAQHVQRLGDGVDTGSEKLHAGAEQVRAVGDEWVESLRATVREHPLACVAGALAAGMLLARWRS